MPNVPSAILVLADRLEAPRGASWWGYVHHSVES